MSTDAWVNNKRQLLEATLTALEKVGTGEPEAYHLPSEETHYGVPTGKMRAARPDLQSEARYNAILERVATIEAAKKAIRAELVYRLTPETVKELV